VNDHLSADAILASAAENPSISDFMAAGDAPLGVEYSSRKYVRQYEYPVARRSCAVGTHADCAVAVPAHGGLKRAALGKEEGEKTVRAIAVCVGRHCTSTRQVVAREFDHFSMCRSWTDSWS
jgi:hypothetical protein